MALSRLRKVALWSAAGLTGVFLLLQLKQAERTNPPVESEIQAPAAIAAILERSCYNCHSHETDWPWYAYVSPVSWWVVEHVDHARKDMNFSQWPVFDFEELEHTLRDIEEQIETRQMPLKSYLILHPEARLSEQDRQALLAWARGE